VLPLPTCWKDPPWPDRPLIPPWDALPAGVLTHSPNLAGGMSGWASEDCTVYSVMGFDLSLPSVVTDSPASDSSEDTVMSSSPSASSLRPAVGLQRSA
jgi:hypothetical protein